MADAAAAILFSNIPFIYQTLNNKDDNGDDKNNKWTATKHAFQLKTEIETFQLNTYTHTVRDREKMVK